MPAAPARRADAMRLRPAVASDVPGVRRLVERAFEIFIPRIGVKPMPMVVDYDAVVADGRCWVADDGGQLAGMVQLAVADDHVEVETLAVAPQAQGTGVGGELLTFAEERARSLGRPEVRLCTNA